MRRVIPATAAALLVLATLVAGPQAAFAAPKVPKTGTAVVTITTPTKVPASLVLRRVKSSTRLLAAKPASGTKRTVRLHVAPSTYTVSVPTFVYKGVRYGGSASKARITVRSGRSVALSLRIRALAGARSFTATSISTSTVGLSWKAPKHSKVVLRRSSGSTAPAKRTSGTAVKLKGQTARDAKLTAGKSYTYSLFTAVKGHWSGPLTLHARTSVSGVSTKAAYVAQPGTVFPTAKQISSETANRAGLAVVLKSGAPLPQIGGALVLPISAKLPGGFLGVVTGVGSDGRTIQLHQGGLEDAFQQYDLSTGDPSIRAASAMKTEATHFLRTASKHAVHPLEEGGDPSSPESTSELPCDSSGVDADVSFRHQLDFGHYVNTRISNGNGTFDLAFTAKATGAISADVTSGVTCSADIFSGAQQVSVDPVPLMVKWDLSASVEASGGVTVSNLGTSVTGGFGTRGTIGLGGFHQTSYPILSGQPLTPTVTVDDNVSVEAKLGGSVAFGLGLGDSALGGLAGIKAEVDPIDAKADIGPSQNGTPLSCAKISTDLHWEGDLDAEFWVGWFHAGATAKLIGGDYPYYDPFYLPTGCNVPASPGTGSGPGGGSSAPTPTPTPTAATDARTISNASTSSDLNCTLNTNEDTSGEYFGGSACGTFLSAAGTLYGPASIPAGGALSNSTTPVAWTPVSQTNSGSGTASDPYTTVTTVQAASTGLEVVQTDQWVSGSTQVTTRMQIVNTTGSTQSVRLYHAFDCYTADDDTGTGGIDAANQTVGCVHINSDNAAVLSLRLHAVTPGATWSEGGYSDNWAEVGAQGDLDDSAITTGDYDNGESIAWATTVPAGGSSTFDAVTSFGGPM